MELLIEGFHDKKKKEYQETDGMYLDVCEWDCVTCDDDERVIEIEINSDYASGTVELCYLPPKVKVLDISPWWGTGELKGSLDLTHLPGGIKSLSLDYNELTGEIDLRHLPVRMRSLNLRNNQLTGEIDFTRLPDRMEYLTLNNNQLTGSLVIKRVPPTMKMIDL